MSIRVAAIAADGVSPLDLGAVAEVFGNHWKLADPWYELTVCAAEPCAVRTRGGLSAELDAGLEAVDGADLVIALPVESYLREPPPEAVTKALAGAHDRGARVASLCVGAFALGAAGLLDGRVATTHWLECDTLAARYPRATVVPGALYQDADRVLTSGGVAAGIDLCMHIVRTDHGAETANRLGRRLVMGPHRDGGQAQYIERPIPERGPDPIGVTMTWAMDRLDQPLTIAALAGRSHMSTRTFVRQFRRLTGTTPRQWLIAQRMELAQRLLETTDIPVEQVARRAGFGTSLSLRQHFISRLHTSPSAYRRTFAQA